MRQFCRVSSAYIFALRKLRNRKVLGACTTVRNGAHISYSESCLRCPALYLVFSLDPLASAYYASIILSIIACFNLEHNFEHNRLNFSTHSHVRNKFFNAQSRAQLWLILLLLLHLALAVPPVAQLLLLAAQQVQVRVLVGAKSYWPGFATTFVLQSGRN